MKLHPGILRGMYAIAGALALSVPAHAHGRTLQPWEEVMGLITVGLFAIAWLVSLVCGLFWLSRWWSKLIWLCWQLASACACAIGVFLWLFLGDLLYFAVLMGLVILKFGIEFFICRRALRRTQLRYEGAAGLATD